MSDAISMESVLKLSVAERIQLAQDIWDSIAAVPDSVGLTDAQLRELDRRIDAYHKDPAAGSPWEDVKARIRGTR
ncbi:addiction module protein [Planctomycetota bacterium]